jgi:hypothetical protein
VDGVYPAGFYSYADSWGMKYYIPLALLAIGIIIGFYLGGNKEAEQQLIKKLEAERKVFFEAISQKDAQIVEMAEQSREIRDQMERDSAKFAHTLNLNEQAYLSLKKKYYEINLRRANSFTLDSIVSRLYSE